jgi:hypothetical protein
MHGNLANLNLIVCLEHRSRRLVFGGVSSLLLDLDFHLGVVIREIACKSYHLNGLLGFSLFILPVKFIVKGLVALCNSTRLVH